MKISRQGSLVIVLILGICISALGAPLVPPPVTYINLRAYEKRSSIIVEWSNLTEQNLSRYIVQRSADGRTYKDIQSVSIKGNKHLQEDYSITDDGNVSGVHFYRIKAIALDSGITNSRVIRVDPDAKEGTISLFPNPVTGHQFSIQISGLARGSYTLTMYDPLGKLVRQELIEYPGGILTQLLSLPVVTTPGIYRIELNNDEKYRHCRTFAVH